MDLVIGHKVVHKTHGVGEILGTEVLSLGGQQQSYYILKILETGLTLRFPMSNSGMIRELVNQSEIDQILSILREPAKTHSAIWNRRKKEYSDKIRSGSVLEIAAVLRDLASRDRLRQPSFGEKEMIDRARGRLVSEISIAKGLACNAVESMLDQALENRTLATS